MIHDARADLADLYAAATAPPVLPSSAP